MACATFMSYAEQWAENIPAMEYKAFTYLLLQSLAELDYI